MADRDIIQIGSTGDYYDPNTNAMIINGNAVAGVEVASTAVLTFTSENTTYSLHSETGAIYKNSSGRTQLTNVKDLVENPEILSHIATETELVDCKAALEAQLEAAKFTENGAYKFDGENAYNPADNTMIIDGDVVEGKVLGPNTTFSHNGTTYTLVNEDHRDANGSHDAGDIIKTVEHRSIWGSEYDYIKLTNVESFVNENTAIFKEGQQVTPTAQPTSASNDTVDVQAPEPITVSDIITLPDGNKFNPATGEMTNAAGDKVVEGIDDGSGNKVYTDGLDTYTLQASGVMTHSFDGAEPVLVGKVENGSYIEITQQDRETFASIFSQYMEAAQEFDSNPSRVQEIIANGRAELAKEDMTWDEFLHENNMTPAEAWSEFWNQANIEAQKSDLAISAGVEAIVEGVRDVGVYGQAASYGAVHGSGVAIANAWQDGVEAVSNAIEDSIEAIKHSDPVVAFQHVNQQAEEFAEARAETSPYSEGTIENTHKAVTLGVEILDGIGKGIGNILHSIGVRDEAPTEHEPDATAISTAVIDGLSNFVNSVSEVSDANLGNQSPVTGGDTISNEQMQKAQEDAREGGVGH